MLRLHWSCHTQINILFIFARFCRNLLVCAFLWAEVFKVRMSGPEFSGRGLQDGRVLFFDPGIKEEEDLKNIEI